MVEVQTEGTTGMPETSGGCLSWAQDLPPAFLFQLSCALGIKAARKINNRCLELR